MAEVIHWLIQNVFFKNPSLPLFLQIFEFPEDVVYSEYIALLKN